jgi:hypothetical protein
VKVADWFGMQPFSSHTSPVGHVPFVLRGTHAPATQTSVALAQSFVTEQGCAIVEQTPVAVLHV